MKFYQYIFKGFTISFLGSLPLGYLNAFGILILKKYGIQEVLSFLLGIICIEFLMLWLSFKFSHYIVENTFFKKYIDYYSIGFLILIAIYFFNLKIGKSDFHFNLYSNSFFTGIYLNLINIVQIPFWLGWISVLFSKSSLITISNKLLFIFSACIGTFFAMLSIIYLLTFYIKVEQLYFILSKLWIVFLGMTIYKVYKLFKK